MMAPFDVLVIGRGCLDNIAVLERFPDENQKAPLEFRLVEGGGQGATASCCVSRLGGRAVYVGKVGDDSEGRFCLERLNAFSVDTRYVETVAGGRTPTAYIFVTRDSGARTIIYERNDLPPIILDDTLGDLVRRAPAILLDPETTYMAEALKPLKRPETRIVYDCERWRKGITAMMDIADYFIPSSGFLESKELGLSGLTLPEKIRRLAQRIQGRVIVTHGEDGAYGLIEDRILHVPAPRITAVDTTGAGDNFHAAFALAVARGWDPLGALKLAIATASLSCRAYGGRRGIPSWNEAVQAAEKLQVRAASPD
jgi:sugar/nucleoside kinase (ribokinase family)